MNYFFTILFLWTAFFSFAQKDSLQIGDAYLEDQLYITTTYNLLQNQPNGLNNSGFSYGIGVGFIKDLPINKKRTIAVGLGFGYSFDSFNHNLKITGVNSNKVNFEIDNSLISNKFTVHNLEFPIEFRWRNSTAKRYNFWRIYSGVKFSYNLSNNFKYTTITDTFSFKNIANFNNWQTGFILSAGYGAFNFHVYYGLTSIFKNAILDGTLINTTIIKLGVNFYFL